MALSASTLKNELLKLMDPDNPNFAGFPSSAIAAADNFSNAYATYAQGAADAFGNGVMSAFKPLFKAALAGWAPSLVQPSPAAALFGNAFAGYWMGASFGVAIPPPGFATVATNIVVLAIPAPLIAQLQIVFSVTYASADAAAQALATAFHTATITVGVLATGVNPTGSPMTLPGVIV